MTDRKKIGIVGAGPAGIMAALEAARAGAEVHLFDTNETVGRKLLVTGNGRCNISNDQVTGQRYHCSDVRFVERALTLHDHEDTRTRLRELGIPTYLTHDGWCYPLSNSAATVVETLGTALDLAGVAVHLKTKVSAIRPKPGGLVLTLGGGDSWETFDRVVVASGGKAYPALGSKGDLFPTLETLGHQLAPIQPALAPILAEVKHLHKLQGVRLDVGLTLYEEDQTLGNAVGNAMFTQTGLSGPVAMDLSHLISTREGAPLSLQVDLVPHHRYELMDLVRRMRRKPMPLRVVLGAVLPVKIPPMVIGLAGLPSDISLADLSSRDLNDSIEQLTHLTLTVTGTRGFQFSQLSTGGVPVTEVNPRNMASLARPGLHFAGEVMDVVGPCGGYNLQWAWTSGAIAGAGAAN